MSATGTVSLNFGAFPGDTAATVDVASTGIVAGSSIEAWILPAATAEHSIDEHVIEELVVRAAYLSDGNLRIYGQATGSGSRSQNGHKLYGNFNIGWVWV
jgi:hypothetical protein